MPPGIGIVGSKYEAPSHLPASQCHNSTGSPVSHYLKSMGLVELHDYYQRQSQMKPGLRFYRSKAALEPWLYLVDSPEMFFYY